MRAPQDCFALLFDGSSPDALSRVFAAPTRSWCVFGTQNDAPAQMQQALNEIDAAARTQGLHVIVSLSYEAQAAFSGATGLALQPKPNACTELDTTPWLQALAFEQATPLSRAQTLEWLRNAGASASTHLSELQPCVNQHAFEQHIHEIQDWICAGDTYQVNATFPLSATLRAHATNAQHCAALAQLYHALAVQSHVPYGALLCLQHNSLLSFSPELFFELNQHTLTCRPMKGTAPAALEPLDNSGRMAQLKLDPKNRAENLMIVDLMRNDLARLPQTVRVRVPSLFDVHHYGAVLQMTSAVVADLNAQPALFEILTALFPCGSITGAPKRRTVELFDAIEPFARGAYCGAIGWVSHAPDAHNGQIQATFSVPIRTIETRAQALTGAGNIQIWPLQLSVGAGITYDSNPTDEWHESLLKAGFLRQLAQPFELIETMRVHQDGRTPLLEAHLNRLKQSMTLLNWHTPLPDVNALIQTTLAQAGALLQAHPFVALRLALNEQGDLSATTRAPEALCATVLFSIHPEKVASTNPFLRIKSSARSLYNRAIVQARARGLFDYVFLNEKNELTEGARSSIFVLLDGGWCTPPLACGLLAGVQRTQLLQQLNACERILHTTDIARAQAIVLCNAVYGQLNARYVPPVHA